MSTLVVQMGHVPRTSGATGTAGEQDFARAAAARVKHHVERMNNSVRVIIADPSLLEYKGDAFVAIHCDGGDPSAYGGSVGYRTTEGQRFAHAWMRHYQANGWNRGFRKDNYTAALHGYYGVKRAVERGTRTAFIAEAGFLTNAGDRGLLTTPAGHDRFGIAVAAALTDIGWCNCPSATPVPPPPIGKLRVNPDTAPVLSLHATGEAVRIFQAMLNASSGARLRVDGFYGPATRDACINFQRFWRLVPDGICGRKTWGTLNFACALAGH